MCYIFPFLQMGSYLPERLDATSKDFLFFLFYSVLSEIFLFKF